ncbi:ABC transporter substrate-binding protein [Ammoniphilus sp. 3BR4]|uniref:ABC transporter substrate-binding protein n=1 Tax=Ammoniphilus sp. 3BR4 TaxID=3158265 RepID=UPI003465A591
MKKMRKGWTVLLAACMTAAGLLSGCSSSEPASTGSTGDAGGKKDVVHLKVWGAVPEEAGPQQVVENWNKANPDIQVEYIRFVNDEAGNTKLETALLADGQVDLFFGYRADKVVKRVEAGMTEPLDQYIEKDNFNIAENFGENSIFKFGDKIHYIPAIILNDFVGINKSYLDEAGLPIPKDWTWEEYKEYAKKLTKGEGPEKVWGSFVGGPAPKIYEYVDKAVKVQLGPDILYKQDGTSNLDHPAFKQFLDHQVEMQNELKVQPPFAEVKATKMQGQEVYLGGKAALHWWGTASIRNIKNTKDYPHDFVTAFAPVPKFSKDDQYVTAGTGYLDFMSINTRSKHKDAAWKFMKWYVTEGNEPMIPFGRIPAWKKVDQNKVVQMVLGENPEKLFDVESFKHVLFLDKEFIVDTKFDMMPEIQKIVEEESERTYIGEQTTEQAIANMKKRSDGILKK